MTKARKTKKEVRTTSEFAPWEDIAFDHETNGLYHEATVMHSLVLKCLVTGEVMSCADQPGFTPIAEGLEVLSKAKRVSGHNIIRHDIPTAKKLYRWWGLRDDVDIWDTLVLARLLKPADTLRRDDLFRVKRDELPANLKGAHSLKAWGYRLGVFKGAYGEQEEAWDRWSPEMQEYCEGDVEVTEALVRYLEDILGRQDWGSAPWVETEVSIIIAAQELHGFLFDIEGAHRLHAELAQAATDLEAELQETFPPRWVPDGKLREGKRPFRTKAGRISKSKYVEGCPYQPVKLEVFNPGSRPQIADRLKGLGWTPVEFTDTGQPKVEEKILNRLPWWQAHHAAEYLATAKALGTLSNGKGSWINLFKEHTGRLHGGVNPQGAVTRRMTHSDPNLANVRSVKKGKDGGPLMGRKGGFGYECRSLFIAPEAFKLVGVDADSLELLCLAHYLYPHDNGAFAEAVLKGDKKKGTDPHSMNCRALGMDPKETYVVDGIHMSGRDVAKRWFSKGTLASNGVTTTP